MGSLLQCFKVRIRAQIFGPDLGSMRPPPLLHLVAHLLIGTSLLTSYVSVLIHKNILNSSLPWRAQKQIHNTNSYAFQPATVFPKFFFLLVFIYCLLTCTYETPPFFSFMFNKLWRCSDNANSIDFLFFLSATLLHPKLFASCCSPLLDSEFHLSFFF